MSAGQTHPWSREAIHDTVAAIVKQIGYRRDLRSTLLDRILQWIADVYHRLFDALGSVPHGRFITTVAAGVVALLIVSRVTYAARLRTASHDGGKTGTRGGSRSGDPWSEAARLAEGDHFTEAAHALYHATVARLAAGGLVRLHESKTSGDYVRELRRRGAASHMVFRRFGARYDRIIYGTGVCDAEDYRRLLEDAKVVLATGSAERAA